MDFGGGHRSGAGHPYGAPSRGDGGAAGAALPAMLRSWAAGIVVLLVAQSLVDRTLGEYAVTPERVESFGWRMVLFHIPAALCVALATLAAARLHREPFRGSPAAHLTAALTVPLVAYGASLLMIGSRTDMSGQGIALSGAATLAGCAAGMAADLVMDSRR
ncbi:hypothetical protein SUDANB106_03700 [Streptomyces sp. enrichment culture]|uniref:hypothetical protein n=1 Tax=Streptomyces sp. enrichment culture TaxID=1795815 RepID=UPI003F5622DE